MTYIVTPDEMRAVESAAIDSGRTEAELICEAAAGIAEWIEDNVLNYLQSRKVVGLIGPGKNGADALVAMSYLVEMGWDAAACLIKERDLTSLPVEAASLEQIEMVDSLTAAGDISVILDGMYGAGGRAELPPEAAELAADVARIRRSHAIPVVAVDLPSGVDPLTGAADPNAIAADVTLVTGFIKVGLLHDPAATLAGDIYTVQLQIAPPESDSLISVLQHETVVDLLPKRQATDGKHEHGGVLVIGGAPNYFGAPRLAAEAALRVGTGVVGAAVPRTLISTIAAQVPEIVYVPLVDTDARRSVNDLTEALSGEHSRYSATVLGPGLGRDKPAEDLLAGLFGQAATRIAAPIGFGALEPPEAEETVTTSEQSALGSVPVVLDADALNWLSGQENWPQLLSNMSAVLTPHHGEMARLLGIEIEEVRRDPRETARAAAAEWGQVVVLKGGFTAIAAPDGRLAVAHRATPELGTAGTGDVLAGVIGGFLAQGLQPFDAACVAVYIGAEAGRFARNVRSSRGVAARDVIENLGSVLDVLDGSWVWS